MSTRVPVAKVALVAVSLWLVVLAYPATSCAQEYAPPLGKAAPLTSTFCEYRTRHFHGGVDLGTGGETGKEVYAAASGYLWRLRVSGAGYGKAIYLRLDDGRTAVYAHLEDFSPRIRQVAEELQRQGGTYRIDHVFEAGALRVEAGEMIAHSGDTGAGPAHLHFELRDGEVQLNPLTHGLHASDTLPPRIRSLIFIPIGPGSLVDGRREPLAVGLRWNGSRMAYTTGRVPVLQGDVGVACRLYDLADGKPNRLAPYRVELCVDGEIAYEVVFDTVSLLSSHHVELVYSYWHAMRGSRDVLNLFYTPGTRANSAIDRSPWCGTLGVEGSRKVGRVLLVPGPHDIEVRAFDVRGNGRTAALRVVADNRPLISSAELDSTGEWINLTASDPDSDQLTFSVGVSADSGFTWKELLRTAAASPYSGKLSVSPLGRKDIIRVTASDQWGIVSPVKYLGPGLSSTIDSPPEVTVALSGDCAEVSCRVSTPAANAPAVWLVDPAGSVPIKPLKTERITTDSFLAFIPMSVCPGGRAAILAWSAGPDGPQSSMQELCVRAIEAGEDTNLELPGGAVLEVPAGALLNEAPVMPVLKDSMECGWNGELVPMSRAIELLPAEQFFDEPVTLFLPLEGRPQEAEKVGLYQRVGGGQWSWVGRTPRGQDTLIGGSISHFSEFILMEDLEPPKVYRLRPLQGQEVSGHRPFLEARVKDGGSGLDWDSVYFTIDGEALITAWEADRSHAWVRVPHDLPPGPHEVEFFAADRAGNETVRTVSIIVTR